MPQIVDDDGDVVVQLALPLVGGTQAEGQQQLQYQHKPTSSTTSPPAAAPQILGPFSGNWSLPRDRPVGTEGEAPAWFHIPLIPGQLTGQLSARTSQPILWENPATIQLSSLESYISVHPPLPWGQLRGWDEFGQREGVSDN